MRATFTNSFKACSVETSALQASGIYPPGLYQRWWYMEKYDRLLDVFVDDNVSGPCAFRKTHLGSRYRNPFTRVEINTGLGNEKKKK